MVPRATALLALLTLALAAPPAAANAGRTSSFRLIDIRPAACGAVVTLQYFNEWPQPWQNEAYRRVRLWAYQGDPTGRPLLGCWTDDEGHSRAAGGINLGTRRMPGSGALRIELDYASLGLKPGEMLYMSGHWRDHGHEWGEPYGRPAGGLELPQPLPAQKNSWLRSARTWRAARCVVRPPVRRNASCLMYGIPAAGRAR